jgi:GT2 family glycosyltransferase
MSHGISVVIPTYQRCASVARALRAFRAQSLNPKEYEILVSIDGSSDGTREMVETFPAAYEVHALWLPQGGRATACNAGIRAARGELIVLMDDDMEPVPEFLAAHRRAHAPEGRSGVLGAVPVVVDRDSPPIVEFMAARFQSHLQKLSRPDHEIGIRDVYTGNFSIRREVIAEVGLFDEGFRIYGNEDGELAIRLRDAGVQLAFCPEAVAYQHYEKDFASLARDKTAQGRTSVACALRHPDTVSTLRIGTYRQVSRKWRWIRATLLAASRRFRSLPDWIVRYVRWSERRRARKLQARYRLALDYFFWLGVFEALRDSPTATDFLLS